MAIEVRRPDRCPMTNLTAATSRSTAIPDETAADRQDAERRNEATMRRIYSEVFGRGRTDLLDSLVAPNVANHTAPEGHRVGPEPIRGLVAMLREAFPDGHTEIESILAHGDDVVMRCWFEGTHLGPFLGHEATGRRFRFRQMHWMRFDAEGRVIEHWGVRDDVTHLQQLGII
jgi:predicted ester cyclase